MNNKRGLLALFTALSLIFLSGCVKRNLHIRSNPAGADVYFNEERIGTTPLDFDFMYYATHKVELKKDGYEPIEALEDIRSPFYLWIPFDLFLELTPYDFWDRRELSYILTPLKEKE